MMSCYSENEEPRDTVAEEIFSINKRWEADRLLKAAAEDMATAIEWLLTEPTSEKGWEFARMVFEKATGRKL